MTDTRYMIHSTSFSQTSLELVIFFKSILTEAGCTVWKKKKLYHKIFPSDSSWDLVFLFFFFITRFYYAYFTKSYIYIFFFPKFTLNRVKEDEEDGPSKGTIKRFLLSYRSNILIDTLNLYFFLREKDNFPIYEYEGTNSFRVYGGLAN